MLDYCRSTEGPKDLFNGRKIYGGCTPPLQTFLISDFILKDTKNIFYKCYKNYLRHLLLKFFIFQNSGRWFPWHPKGGCTPPINLEVFFTDILATTSRLNTSHGHFSHICEVIYVGFFRHFAVFGYSKCDKVCRDY